MSSPYSDDSDTAVVGSPPSENAPQPIGVTVGTSVGRYVVIEEIGHGGMGRVLRAYDPKLQREVALKEVRRAHADEEMTARLVVEARAMAKLSHPNVVAVFDVETLQDSQLIVMELVEGTTLRSWLAAQRRGWQEIVDTFVRAGRGLAAAHAVGLLHRDFKPANVLIGSGGAVKVTDFGLAKGMFGPAYADSLVSGSGEPESVDGLDDGLTRDGVVLGTPRYMAPEQHQGKELTPGADQYAFCVALWEALCGAPPFDTSSGERHSAKQKLDGPPAWPTSSVPRAVASAVRRGLCVEPADRWPSMEALLDALAHEPGRRRRRLFGWVAGATTLGLAATAWRSGAVPGERPCSGAERHLAEVWDEARRARAEAAFSAANAPYATRMWHSVSEELDAYTHAWVESHTEACMATTVRGERSAEVMDLQMACLQRAKVELTAVVDELVEADPKVVGESHRLLTGLRDLDQCADVEALRAGVEPPLPEEQEQVAAGRTSLAQARAAWLAGRYDHAQSKVQAAKEALKEVTYEPVQIEAALQDADVLAQQGEYEAAVVSYERALTLATERGELTQMQKASTRLLHLVGFRLRQMEDALKRYRLLAVGLSKNDPAAQIVALSDLALVLYAKGDYEEAEHQLRLALEIEPPIKGRSRSSKAQSRNTLAVILSAQGKFDEAEAELRGALAVKEELLGPDHPEVGTSRANLGSAAFSQGKLEEAETEYRAALEIFEKALGPEHLNVAMARTNIGLVMGATGRHEECVAQLRQPLAVKVAALGDEHPDVARLRDNLAQCLVGLENFTEAEAQQRQALDTYLNVLGPDHDAVAGAQHSLANILLESRRPHEALTLAERAWTRRQRDDVAPPRRGATQFLLATILWDVGGEDDRRRARDLARGALETLAAAGERHADAAEEVRAWLDAR